ncbi:hypothetical protein DICVIV_09115 [Dictyocaulus viviparus]|uniref:Uncharacterized protein n=1 Tax=Dictyocaulus viviparus TaxID=29172 RepID=A0A0D8XJU7_DICVI|nr:hypothetical protein DICVIV_09115 [Dictyocaulus viviparus]
MAIICGMRWNEIQTSLTRVEEERDSLKSLLKTAEDEMKLLRDSLEEQVAMNEQVQHDVAKLRSKTGALIQEVDSKDNIITDLKNDLLAAERMCQEMKVVILEREAEAKEIRTVLEEEQERRKNEREDWKSAVLAAQETSSALRYDLEKIRNEFTAKEETIRNLSEQLRIADENNFRMAEVISEHASNERGDLCVRKDINYKSFVNTKDVSKTSTTMVKSRDSQTDITRDALIKMESDSCSLSNEMNVLRVAYVDLSHAVGKLVVKELEPVPNEVDILWIEKSCKELCRLIHHERRRREVQANEVAAMASKLEEMKQKWLAEYLYCLCVVALLNPMDCTSGVLKEICPTMNTEANKRIFNKKKFCNPMRQTLFVLTTMAVDLVTSLRKLSSLYSSGKQISFLSSIELARNLRNELNDRFLIVRTENENENRHSLVDLIHMVKILEKDNQLLHQNIKSWKDEYEALSAKNANKPELAERIATQLRSIHNVMSESRRACGLLQEAKKETAQPTSASESRQ